MSIRISSASRPFLQARSLQSSIVSKARKQPDFALITASIVAVPGLGSHAIGSFKSNHGWEVWLRDFLPTDIPACRVLLYGYDTQVAESTSKASVGDLAKLLLAALKAFRYETAVRTDSEPPCRLIS